MTFAFLLLAFLLPCSGFAGVLTASSSEAEVEFFGDEEFEECLIVVQKNRSDRRSTGRPRCQALCRILASRTRYAEVFNERAISGHRYPNGLLAPIRC